MNRCLRCGRCCTNPHIPDVTRSTPDAVYGILLSAGELNALESRIGRTLRTKMLLIDGKPMYAWSEGSGRCPFLIFKVGVPACSAGDDKPRMCRDYWCGATLGPDGRRRMDKRGLGL